MQNKEDPKYIKWIESLIPKQTYLIVLDEKGKSFSSMSFYKKFEEIEFNHKHITLIVGGSYGLPKSIIDQANLCLCLSKMTLPHKLAFLVLVEQVYRCFTLKKNIPYHHE